MKFNTNEDKENKNTKKERAEDSRLGIYSSIEAKYGSTIVTKTGVVLLI